jgi:adenylate cyclase
MLRFLRLPSRIPVRLPARQASQKWLAAVVIAVIATVITVGWRRIEFISEPVLALDELLYDAVYRLRTPEDRKASNVVIVAIDQDSITKLAQKQFEDVQIDWPWPRELYGDMVQYFERCGARVVAFDMLFADRGRQSEQLSDETFAELLAEAKIPVVFGTLVDGNGTSGPFAPPVKDPILGAVNAGGSVLRTYFPFINGYPSLGFRTAALFTGSEQGLRRGEFRIHYYGPHRRRDGSTTFRYMTAFNVLAASRGAAGLDPDLFRGKVVLVGGTAAGTHDVKSTPLPNEDPTLDKLQKYVYPGVEYQATAVENLLFHQRVRMIQPLVVGCVTFVGAVLASAASLFSQRTAAKIAAALLAAGLVLGVGIALFRGKTIWWLPLASPLLAVLISTVGAIAWSYFTEGRQRLFISKAFALSTSPVIAEAISRNPEKLKLGGERREITVMFTDLAGFTDLSETMEVEQLAKVINTYMEAMSEQIVLQDGYLDKYIGDAIMSFWNGLVDQPEHAVRACRAALGIKRRELEIAPELQKLVAAKIMTRIGIHCGPMAVGNLGSSRKLSYTVLGDAVNLAARLEPANKLYDTEVLISQTVAEQVKDRFVVRELDLLAVKGKKIPMAVYELIAEGQPTPAQRRVVELYGQGLAHYRAQRWDDAENTLKSLLAEFPDDGPAASILKRVAKLRREPPGANWDGVYVAKEK